MEQGPVDDSVMYLQAAHRSGNVEWMMVISITLTFIVFV